MKSVRTHKILDITRNFLGSGPSNQVDLKLLGLTKCILHSVKHLQIVGRFTKMCKFFITAKRTFEIVKNSQDSRSYQKVPRLWTTVSNQVDLKVLDLTKYILHSVKHLQLLTVLSKFVIFSSLLRRLTAHLK